MNIHVEYKCNQSVDIQLWAAAITEFFGGAKVSELIDALLTSINAGDVESVSLTAIGSKDSELVFTIQKACTLKGVAVSPHGVAG